MTNDGHKMRRWWPRFTLAGVFLVVTIVCVRMAVESHRYQTRRLIEIRVEVASPIEPAVERQIRSELHDIDGVSFIVSGDRFIRVRMRVYAKQDVLDVLERHGIPVESVQDIF